MRSTCYRRLVSVYDAAIVGLGAMGSAAAWQLARRGARVIGADRFTPPHTFGSTHGQTRIIREAYFEHPLYVPLVRRAYELWSVLAAEAGVTLFHKTGGLMIGRPDSTLVHGSRESAIVHGIPFEEWSAREIRRRVPALAPDPDMIAIREARAGVLLPEPAVAAMLAEARRHGADLRFETTVSGWSRDGDDIEIHVANQRVRARAVVLAAGPWLPAIARELSLPLTLERAVQGWFAPRDGRIGAPDAFPVFILEEPDGELLYGLPDVGQGVKLAGHHGGETTTLETIRRTVDAADRERLERVARRRVPGVVPELRQASTCLYTNTPDQHFILDRHPADDRVVVISACSGHGFKFAPAIGEVAAAMAADDAPRFDLTPFAFARFG
jgi:sarcosine oxidase